MTARIAFEVGGSRKGHPFKDENGQRVKFWDAIPFSRIVHGRRGWRSIDRDVLKNELEAQGYSKDHAIQMARKIYDSDRFLTPMSYASD